MTAEFAERCRRAIDGDAVVTDGNRLNAYAVDGIVPDVLLVPGTVDEAVSVVRLASEQEVPLLFRGSGTKLRRGLPLKNCPAILSTERLRDVVDFNGKNFTVTVQGGMPLDALDAYLVGENMFFPFDPPYPRSTVGGNIASKANGPSRLMYGALRDLLLGVEVVLASGEVVRFGGMVMKNVAGYDMTKFFVGTLGTVGLIAEATLKLHVLPERRETVAAWFDSPAAALKVSRTITGSYLEPCKIVMLDSGGYSFVVGSAPAHGADAVYLLIGFEGAEEDVRREVREALELCRETGGREEACLSGEAAWERIRELHQRFADAHSDGVVCRINVCLAKVEPVVEELKTVFQSSVAPAAILCDSGCGMVYCYLQGAEASEQATTVESLSRLAHANEGFFRIELAPMAIRQRGGYLPAAAPATAVMERLQRRFDPKGILHPEKLFGHA